MDGIDIFFLSMICIVLGMLLGIWLIDSFTKPHARIKFWYDNSESWKNQTMNVLNRNRDLGVELNTLSLRNERLTKKLNAANDKLAAVQSAMDADKYLPPEQEEHLDLTVPVDLNACECIGSEYGTDLCEGCPQRNQEKGTE